MQYRSRCNIFNSFGNALLIRYIYKGRPVKILANIAFLLYKEILMKYLILYYNNQNLGRLRTWYIIYQYLLTLQCRAPRLQHSNSSLTIQKDMPTVHWIRYLKLTNYYRERIPNIFSCILIYFSPFLITCYCLRNVNLYDLIDIFLLVCP